MTDLDQTFREAQGIPVNDLWPAITTRTPRPPEPPSRRRRVTVVVVAVIVAGVGVGLVLRALSRELGQPLPASPPTERWVRQIPGQVGYTTSIGSYEGNVYAGSIPPESRVGLVTALDPHGNQLWSVRTPLDLGEEVYGLAVDGTGVYAGSAYGFTKFHLDGARVWTRPTRAVGGYARFRWVAMDGSGVYLYTPTGTLEKVDPDGNLIWSTNFLSSVSPSNVGVAMSMVAAPSGGVYISFEGCPGSAANGCDRARRGDDVGRLGTRDRLDFDLLRIDGNGNVLWTTRLGVGRENQFPIVANADGVYALAPAWACGVAGVRDDTCLLGFDEAGDPTMHVQLAMAASSKAPRASALASDVTGVFVVESGSFRAGSAEIHRYDADGNETWVQRVSLGRGYLTAAVANGNGLAIVTEDYRRERYVSSVASVPLTQMTAGDGGP